jgi:hypothetical protein
MADYYHMEHVLGGEPKEGAQTGEAWIKKIVSIRAMRSERKICTVSSYMICISPLME